MTRFKQVFGLAGILVALAGIALESRWLVWAAIGLLAASVLFRIIIRIGTRERSETNRGD